MHLPTTPAAKKWAVATACCVLVVVAGAMALSAFLDWYETFRVVCAARAAARIDACASVIDYP